MILRRNFIKSLSLVFGGMATSSLFVPRAFALPRTQEDLLAITENIYDTGVLYGDLPSLATPEYFSVSEAALSNDDDEIVFVFAFPEAPDNYYIVSQKIMVWHEVLNELYQGKAYALTYSPVSGTLAFYEAKIGRENLIFDSAGGLYNNNSVLIDRNTGSKWSQLLGMAFEGPLMGTGLKFLPVYWTKWKNARDTFPNAKVMITPKPTSTRIYGRDPYGSYQKEDTYYQNENIHFPLTHYDTRMPAKTQIYAIEDNKALVAISIDYVREKKAVNFYLGPRALLAVHDPILDTVRVFDREYWLDQQPALFYMQYNRIYDYGTRSEWNVHGKCIEGKLLGASMQEFFGLYSFWFAFAASNPETFTVPGDIVVPDSAFDTSPI